MSNANNNDDVTKMKPAESLNAKALLETDRSMTANERVNTPRSTRVPISDRGGPTTRVVSIDMIGLLATKIQMEKLGEEIIELEESLEDARTANERYRLQVKDELKSLLAMHDEKTMKLKKQIKSLQKQVLDDINANQPLNMSPRLLGNKANVLPAQSGNGDESKSEIIELSARRDVRPSADYGVKKKGGYYSTQSESISPRTSLNATKAQALVRGCLLYTSPSPRD